MKHTKRFLILLITAAALMLLFTLTAYAVPAAPHSGKTGAEAACRSHAGTLVTLDDIPGATCVPGRKGAPSLTPATKNIPLAVIVIGFKNISYDNGYDWATTIFEGEKSLSAYYSDMSFGQFTFTPVQESSAFGRDGNTNTGDAVNDGVVHVSLSVDHKDWSNTGMLPTQYANLQKGMLNAFIDAINKANDYIDFAAYDADGDGAISNNELAIGFVVAGYEGSYTEDYAMGNNYYTWAHAWSVTEANDEMGFTLAKPTVDGVTVDAYIAVGEKIDDANGVQQEPISVLAHELGHYLGLPDLYDTTYNAGAQWSGYDVGLLSVMSSGSWGVDPDGGYIPYSMDAWCRYILGWYTPEVVSADGRFTVASQSYTANERFSALMVPTQHVGEYYLLENRQNTKWDAGLATDYGEAPLSSGLILWHIDDNVYDAYNDQNAVNNTDHRPTVMPLFPEGSSGSFSFTGKSKPIYTGLAFFDSAVWQTQYPNLGAALDLPIYGEGAYADKRANRSLSGITLTFLSATAPEMTVEARISGHNHRLSKVAEKPATCTEPGRAAYWCCNICGVKYADDAGTMPVTDAQLVTPALGHTEPNVNGRCNRCGEKLVSSDEGEGDCPFCGENHDSSFLGKIVRFFHRILYFFKNLFRF